MSHAKRERETEKEKEKEKERQRKRKRDRYGERTANYLSLELDEILICV